MDRVGEIRMKNRDICDSMTMDQPQIPSSDQEMSFLEHLEVLRWHIVRSVAAIFLCAIIVFLAKDFVFQTVLFSPKEPDFITYRFLCNVADFLCFQPTPFEIITRELGEQFVVHLKASIWIGLILAFPYVIYEMWRFIRPGLYDKEIKATRGVVLICSLLFSLGVVFGYFVISPFAISFLSGYDVGATSAPTLASYVGYMTMFTIPTGLIFELPMAIYFLAKIGLVGAQSMKTYRRHAIIVILFVAAVITPPDVITQALIALPLYGLYEISIHVAERIEKNQQESP